MKSETMTNNDAKYYTNMGIEKTNQGDFKGAINAFEKAELLNPSWAMIFFSKAIAYHNMKELENAFANYTKAIKLDDKMIDAYYNRAHIILMSENIQENNLQQAKKDFEKAIELDSKFIDAMYYLAIVKMKLKDYQGAVKDLDKILAIEPDAIHSKALKKLLIQKYIK
jgi:tetratricopeptide (TPR) repeat protein